MEWPASASVARIHSPNSRVPQVGNNPRVRPARCGSAAWQATHESGRNNREVGTTGPPWLLLIKSAVVVMRAVDAADHPPTFTHMPMSVRREAVVAQA